MDAEKFETGLLAHNFFPRVAKRGDEFPPSLISTGFTSKIVSKLNSLPIKRLDGYGAVAARSTRYDLAPRNMEVSHPRAFAAISRNLKASWSEWESIISNRSSSIRVADHADGRIYSMTAVERWDSLVFPNSRFLARVDITNFYDSIYTHSIPWAVHGVPSAKANRGDKNDWTNQLDSVLRQARRRETTGISTGLGTSAVVGEILLGQVDSKICNQGYDFVRYIDDYYFVAPTRDEAESFVAAVRDGLATLKLSIHPGKTSIEQMPLASSPRWMRHLRSVLRGPMRVSRILDALDEVIDIADSDTEDGMLRYVLVSIEESFRNDELSLLDRERIIDRILHIGFPRPIAIGTACRLLMATGNLQIRAREEELNLILIEHAKAFRTDACTWIIHTLIAGGISPSEISSRAIVQAGDCLMMTLLAEDGAGATQVKEFIDLLEETLPENYRRDEYWLIYYQFALKGIFWPSVPEDFYGEFAPLLEANVSFVDLQAENPYESEHAFKVPPGPVGAGNISLGPYPG